MSAPVPWGGVRPLGASSGGDVGARRQVRRVEGTIPLPTPHQSGLLWRVCGGVSSVTTHLHEAHEGRAVQGEGRATPPALPAKARDTVHHEPHLPPLLRLCGEVADAQEQRQPHSRGGEHLPP